MESIQAEKDFKERFNQHNVCAKCTSNAESRDRTCAMIAHNNIGSLASE